MARAGRGAIASGEAGGVAGVAMARAGREVSTGGDGRWWAGGWGGGRGGRGRGGGGEAMARAGRGAIASGEAGGVAGVAMARAGREVSTGGEGRWWAGERLWRDYRQGAGAWTAVSSAARSASASVRSD